jgi:DNA-binding transcriptional ArsR family regulator
MNSSSEPERAAQSVVRRKFSLTKEIDEQLQELASQHYQGNVSLCIRAAFKEHQRTVHGEGRLALKRLEQEVSRLSEQISNLETKIAESGSDEDAIGQDSAMRSQRTDGNQSALESQILTYLNGVDTAVRIEDIIEATGISPRAVVQIMGEYYDAGIIQETEPRGRYHTVSNRSAIPKGPSDE